MVGIGESLYTVIYFIMKSTIFKKNRNILDLYDFCKKKVSKALLVISCELMHCYSSVRLLYYFVQYTQYTTSLSSQAILEQLRKSSFSEPSARRRQRRSTTRYVWNSPQKQYWKLSLERPFAHKQRLFLLLLLPNSNRVLLSNNTITAHSI